MNCRAQCFPGEVTGLHFWKESSLQASSKAFKSRSSCSSGMWSPRKCEQGDMGRIFLCLLIAGTVCPNATYWN